MFTRAGLAAIFDKRAFTEAFFDDDAMADGAIVVAAVGALTYLATLTRLGVIDAFRVTELLQVLIGSVASWLILGFATWLAATRLFKSSGRPQTLLAMHGLSPVPLLLDIFTGTDQSFFSVDRLAPTVGLVWYLAILVVATKEGTDLPYKYSGVAVLIGFAAAVLIRALLRVPFALFGGAFA